MMKRNGRFWVGLIMVLAAAILMLTNHGRNSTVPFTALAVVGIALIAVSKREKRRADRMGEVNHEQEK